MRFNKYAHIQKFFMTKLLFATPTKQASVSAEMLQTGVAPDLRSVFLKVTVHFTKGIQPFLHCAKGKKLFLKSQIKRTSSFVPILPYLDYGFKMAFQACSHLFCHSGTLEWSL